MQGIPFLKLFDIETLELLFDAELYVDFHKYWSPETPVFYYFEYFSGYIGILFTSQDEGL
jgi:hypothetical protein